VNPSALPISFPSAVVASSAARQPEKTEGRRGSLDLHLDGFGRHSVRTQPAAEQKECCCRFLGQIFSKVMKRVIKKQCGCVIMCFSSLTSYRVHMDSGMFS
jgi:hypothetical protein